MGIEMKLQMRLSQQLIMTPQLQQAIKLLQLSRTELEELIDQSLIENPVLEEGMDIDSSADSSEEEAAEADVELQVQEPFESAKETEKEESPSEEEIDWQQYLEFQAATSDSPRKGATSSHDDEAPSVEATLAQARSLQDHLIWQLDMLDMDPMEREAGVQLIYNINDDGYLTASIREILQSDPELYDHLQGWLEFNPIPVDSIETTEESLDLRYRTEKPTMAKTKKPVPPVFEEDMEEEEVEPPPPVTMEMGEFMERVLYQIQQFEPSGVGARSLQECLLIQLNTHDLNGSLVYRMIEEDMALLESKDLKKVARRQKVEFDEVLDAWKVMVALEPKPGRSYNSSAPQYIVPDVYIYKFSGDYKVALNESGIPRLRVSNYYKELMEQMEVEKGNLDREYIQEKIKAGQWLMKSIEQRQKTIYRVTEGILKFQREFFEKGIHYLKPLVLKDIAEHIDVHESTVSRITTNKYVHTPQGIFELKYFFTSGIHQDDGEAISSKRIKDIIQNLIQKENPKSPYTDIQLAQILYEKSSIRVARRTVAKYREALNILPSNKRKQLF